MSSSPNYLISFTPGFEREVTIELEQKCSNVVINSTCFGLIQFQTSSSLSQIKLLRSIETVAIAFPTEFDHNVPVRSLPPVALSCADECEVVENYFSSICHSAAFISQLTETLKGENYKQIQPFINFEAFPADLKTSSISFRVSCSRVIPFAFQSSVEHPFKSPQAARVFGSAMRALFHWTVNLINPIFDFALFIVGQELRLGLFIQQQIHKRFPHVTDDEGKCFNPPKTALNCSTAYCMGVYAQIQAGQLVYDPFAGIGTLPLECALEWRNACYTGSDIDSTSLNHARRAYQQIKQTEKPAIVEFLLSDSRFSCFLPCSVDLLISDIPFGHRHGTFSLNQSLYSHFIRECGRMMKIGGKMIILTSETKLFRRTLETFKQLRLIESLIVSIGGLRSEVFKVEKLALFPPLSEDQIKRFSIKEKLIASKRKVAQAHHQSMKRKKENNQQIVDETQANKVE
jgi:tRNA G10  N-methylase Trm11